ncbi:MAG: cell division topological specificity factor MinE [Firmicutes bacterium HGW-Firmicutes-7]|nr:MAG: cell division topological specificity factor MinE [Firmicutes bacterium HGW-Firmicutes-7]
MGIFGKKTSRNVAKDRLKLVLIHDRANCSSEILEMIKTDILHVINKYMEVEEQGLEVKIGTTRSDRSNTQVPVLYANIPIRNMRNAGVKHY